MNLNITAIFLGLSLMFVSVAEATPRNISFQSRIYKPDGTALEAGSVQFRFSLLNPISTCVIYSEIFSNIDLSGSAGSVVLALGTGTRSYPTSGTMAWYDAFNNATPSYACQSTGTYSPALIDIRRLVMQFNDGTATGWQTLPPLDINSVPFAMYAENAEKLGGLTATDFVLGSALPTCSGSNVLTYNGSLFSCVSASPTAIAPSIITAGGAAIGEVLKWNGTNWVASADNSSAGSVTSVSSANSYLSVTSGATTPLLTLNVGTAANTVAAGNDSRINGAFQSVTALSGDLSGTLPNANLATIGSGGTGNIITYDSKGRVTGSSNLVSSDVTAALGYVPISSQWTTLNASGDLSYMAGNVGIGTTAPGANERLAVQTSSGLGVRIGPNLNDGSTALFVNTGAVNQNAIVARGMASQTAAIFDVQNSATTSLLNVQADGKVGIGTTTPATSALLDVDSTTKGFLLPRMTSVQRDAIVAPATGLQVYNISGNTIDYYNGTSWTTSSGLSGGGAVSGSNGAVNVTASGTNQNVTLTSSGSGVVTTPSVATITNASASTGASNGALVVTGGVGVGGAINATGNISTNGSLNATTSLITPLIYGSTAASGDLTIESTSNVSKGKILLAPNGGNVGIGTTNPSYKLSAAGPIVAVTTDFATGTTGSAVGLYTGASTGNTYGVVNATQVGGSTSSNLSLQPTGGNVGIGVINPTEKFQIGNAINTNLSLSTTGGSKAFLGTFIDHVSLSMNRRPTDGAFVSSDLSHAEINIATASNDSSIQFATSASNNVQATNRMVIDRNGRIAVGTTDFSMGNTTLNPNAGYLTLVGNGTDVSSSHGRLIIGNNRATVTAGDGVGRILFQSQGNQAGDLKKVAMIASDLEGSGGAGGFGGNLSFFTKADNSSNDERMRITASGNVGIGTSTPAVTALIEMSSTTKGFLLPRMTSVQRDAITSPATGLQVYNTSGNTIDYYNGTSWTTSSGLSGGGSVSGSSGAVNITASGTSQNITLTPSGTGVVTTPGAMMITNSTNSTNSTTGALVISGGVGVSGDISSGGNIRASLAMTAPQIYGSSAASSDIKIDGTSNASKGNVLLVSAGGNVGIGATGPAAKLSVVQSSNGRIAMFDSAAAVDSFSGREVEIQGKGSGTALHAETQGSGVAATIWNNNSTNLNPALFVIQSGTGPAAVFSGGNVGIGTSTPGAKLHVVGPAIFSQGTVQIDPHPSGVTVLDMSVAAPVNLTRWRMMIESDETLRFRRFVNPSGSLDTLVIKEGSIAVGYTPPLASAVLDLQTTSKGFLLPRMTSAQRDAIVAPATGLQVYNTSGNTIDYYNGISWTTSSGLSGGGAVSGSNGAVNIAASGTNQSVTLTSSGSGVVTTPSVTTITNAGASTGASNGALVVTGGVGVGGALNATGNISTSGSLNATTSLITPLIYGSTAASGDITIESTSNVSKGKILLAPNGGNVGIGTLNPLQLLHISRTVATSPAITVGGSDVPTYATLQVGLSAADAGNVGSRVVLVDGGTSGKRWDMTNGGLAASSLSFKNQSDGITALTLAPTGNVGIGTTTPTVNLEVNGSTGIAINSSTQSSVLQFNQSGVRKANIAVTSAVGGWSLDSAVNDMVIRTESNKILFNTNGGIGNSSMAISGGNVGIGTTTPAAQLDVNGNAAVRTQLYVGGASQIDTAVSNPALSVYGNLDIQGGSTVYYNSGIRTYCSASGCNSNQNSAQNFSLSSSTGNKYNIVVNGGGTFTDNVGIGVGTATARLQIASGDGTSGKAPLKLTSGVNLVTPEAGAVEYDGTNLYFTDSGAARRTIATTNGVSTSYVAKAGDTMSGALNISATSASADLSVTQSGAGPAATFIGGNVGIGTTTPSYLVDVATSLNGTHGARIGNSSNGTSARARLVLSNDLDYGVININSSTYPIDPNALSINSPATAVGPILFGTSGTERMRIMSNGHVGIGTTTPAYSLQVVSNAVGAQIAARSQNIPNLIAAAIVNYHGAWNTAEVATSQNYNGMYGAVNRVTAAGSLTGTVASASGSTNDVENFGTKTIVTAIGSEAGVRNQSTGLITNAHGILTSIENTGGGTITNGYGIYINPIQATNKFAVYSPDAASRSYFAGNVGIGTTTPAVALQVAGPIHSIPVEVTNVATNLDLSQSSTFTIATAAGAAFTLANPVNAGSYTVVITDTTSRTYTFACSGVTKYKPANTATTSGSTSIYTVLTVKNGVNYDCYINWASGYL